MATRHSRSRSLLNGNGVGTGLVKLVRIEPLPFHPAFFPREKENRSPLQWKAAAGLVGRSSSAVRRGIFVEPTNQNSTSSVRSEICRPDGALEFWAGDVRPIP